MRLRSYLLAVMVLLSKIVTAQIAIAEIPDQVKGIGGTFESINLSDYTQAEGDVFWEVAFLKPETKGTPPSWVLNEENFQFEMTVTAQVMSKGEISVGSEHILAVENEQGELRGVSQAIQVQDSWVFFLSVFSNNSGEQLQFKFYDAAFDQVLLNGDTFEFTPNDSRGTPEDPYLIEVGTFDVDIDGNVLGASEFDRDFIGSDELIVFARLIEDPMRVDSDTLKLEVLDDYVPIIEGIPEQVIAFDENFSSFNLNDYTNVFDEDSIYFSSTGNNDISVSIDKDGMVSLSQPEGYAGTDTITFHVTDVSTNGLTSSQCVVFIVREIEQAPIVSNLPDFKTGLNGAFVPLDLMSYVQTNNLDGIQWTYDFVTDSSVAKPSWSVNNTDFQHDMTVTLEASALGEKMNGDAHLVSAYSQSDSTLLGSTSAIEVDGGWYFFLTIHNTNSVDSVFFKVYEANASRILPVKQTLNFEANSVIGDPLDPFQIDAGYIEVSINEQSVTTFELIAQDWYGVESIAFTATDTTTRELLASTDTLNMQVLNVKSPKILPIPDQEINEGEQFQSIDLAEYLSGVEPSDVSWEISGAEDLSPVLSGNTVEITVPQDYYGVSTLSVFVQSNTLEDLTNEASFQLIVNNVNDAPVFTSNPILAVKVDNLYNYEIVFDDIDNSDLSLEIESKPEWLNFFADNNFGLLYGTPAVEQVGEYEITLILNDGDLTELQSFSIKVVDEKVPVLAEIPPQTITEGSLFDNIILSNYLSGIDASEVSWNILGAEALSPVLIGDTLILSSPEDYFGEEELKVIVYSKKDSSLFDEIIVLLKVENVNDAPVWTDDAKTTADAGVKYEMVLKAVDVDNDTLNFTITSKPDWLNSLLEGNSLILYGIPSFSDLGESEISVSVDDGTDVVTKSFTLIVTNPLGFDITTHAIIYPNPIADQVFFTLKNVSKVELIDLNGKVIHKQTGTDIKSLKIGHIKKGVYFLRLMEETENDVFVERIIKE